ncbi:hypothetical protein L6164_034765 [Bauhinia variegata]|nr:hypothetical protein L6164_034765 [Bauhinia variegata]
MVNLPLKSAELMIDEPGHVITPVDELRRTQRISALGADEELRPGKAYMVVPASRLHSKVSPFEMGITEEWASCENNNKKRRNKPSGNVSKVSPSPTDEINVSRGNVTVTGTRTHSCSRRLPNQRRWSPVLDTVFESKSK